MRRGSTRWMLIFLALWLACLPGVASAMPAAQVFNPQQFEIRLHPDGGLTAGDPVSVEIRAPRSADLNGKPARLAFAAPAAQDFGKANFYPGADGRLVATFTWAWQTRGLGAGTYRLRVEIPDLNLSWGISVELLAPRANFDRAIWKQVETACCRIHFITGTDADRDIESLTKMVDTQAEDVARRLGVDLKQIKDKVDLNLIPRLLGQGGFANDEVYVSYRDNNYVNNNAAMLIHHELVHRLDMNIPSKLRPTFFVEGLAVYLSDGHYQIEPLLLKTAALNAMGWYLPLRPLMDDFYTNQHEIGYLEAGALIEYMVNRWGWERFNAFYRNIDDRRQAQSLAIDAALEAHFGLDLRRLEHDFREALPDEAIPPDVIEQLRLTVEQYDTMRAYQQALDPSAYFRTVWLPDARQMREKGIVADYLSAPDKPVNASLEAALVATARQIEDGEYDEALAGLEAVQERLRFARQPKPEEQVAKIIEGSWIPLIYPKNVVGVFYWAA